MTLIQDLLVALYPWTKSLHIIAVVSWMAGLFYLPRLFVYHAETVGSEGPTHALFATMEEKLLRVIMRPAAVASWAAGLLLVATPGVVDWGLAWPWVKAAAVLAMTWFHVWCMTRRRDFAEGRNALSGRSYRIMNEVPTLLLIAIVVSVVVKY